MLMTNQDYKALEIALDQGWEISRDTPKDHVYFLVYDSWGAKSEEYECELYVRPPIASSILNQPHPDSTHYTELADAMTKLIKQEGIAVAVPANTDKTPEDDEGDGKMHISLIPQDCIELWKPRLKDDVKQLRSSMYAFTSYDMTVERADKIMKAANYVAEDVSVIRDAIEVFKSNNEGGA